MATNVKREHLTGALKAVDHCVGLLRQFPLDDIADSMHMVAEIGPAVLGQQIDSADILLSRRKIIAAILLVRSWDDYERKMVIDPSPSLDKHGLMEKTPKPAKGPQAGSAHGKTVG